ncbi:RNA polymerase sigma factor [Streptomyces sp. 6N223]|uniref:RNA polymerase sigma factor n=1 Tax=Streptomyces sp. 6N223 TaxID=3457412 RepID=UPI003FD4CCEF
MSLLLSLSPDATPAEAFDKLHSRHAVPLTRQVFLLCGRRRTAERAVNRAFRLAWERWPEVARDSDPVGWVRWTAFEYALSPWLAALRWRGPRAWARATAKAHPGPPKDRALLEALLSLPPCYRHAVVLHDAVGLDLPETAAEVEASTAATAGRIVRARDALARWVPRLAETSPAERGAVLRELLCELAGAQRFGARAAGSVRLASERATRRWNEASATLVVLVTALITLALLAD